MEKIDEKNEYSDEELEKMRSNIQFSQQYDCIKKAKTASKIEKDSLEFFIGEKLTFQNGVSESGSHLFYDQITLKLPKGKTAYDLKKINITSYYWKPKERQHVHIYIKGRGTLQGKWVLNVLPSDPFVNYAANVKTCSLSSIWNDKVGRNRLIELLNEKRTVETGVWIGKVQMSFNWFEHENYVYVQLLFESFIRIWGTAFRFIEIFIPIGRYISFEL